MKLNIRTYGDPVLREKAWPVKDVTQDLRDLAKDMIDTMHEERGVGLAAQQVGRTEALCVVDVPAECDMDDTGHRVNPDVPMPLVLFNPEILEASPATASGEEGCLSFPDISAPICRPVSIRVRFLDLTGKPQTLALREFVARAVQHEMDHLNGVLIVDRMSPIKKISMGGRLKRLKRETEDRLVAH